MNRTVAVVDIGSNSIKLLVATRGADGALVELAQRTEETRIGTGITGNPPRLGDEAMTRAIASVRSLLDDAARFQPASVRIVATSAVRDAVNRATFATHVRAASGHDLHVLAGNEEARLIGRGIACEPALRGVPAFYLFDLGGGSLEMLEFRAGQVTQLVSLQLGCVRVTETCLTDPAAPLTAADIARIRAHVRTAIRTASFAFDPAYAPVAVVTGGTATTMRAIKAAAAGTASLAAASPQLAVPELEALATRMSAATLGERRTLAGLPAARADVFPAALWTLVEVAHLVGVRELRHSFFNLRYGVAAELLDR